MPVEASDTLLYPRPRLDPGDLFRRLDRPDDKDWQFLSKLPEWAARAGVDDAALAAIWLLETANGTSERWNLDLNPGGIGIPSDSTVQPFVIADGDEAARIFVQCVYALAQRQAHPDVPIPGAAQDWFTRVWLAKVTSSRMPDVRTISDLNLHYADASGDMQATWAWNPDHIIDLVNRARFWLPDVPDQDTAGGTATTPAGQVVFGRVPRPGNIIDAFVDKPIGNGWDDQGPRDKLLAIVLHAVLGYAWTTGDYFGNPEEPHGYQALTDWGVCGAIDAEAFGPDKDGLIMNWNDPDGRGFFRRPWASGGDGSKAISGDAIAWVNRYGIAAINTYGEAVELSLLHNTDPVSPKMLQSVIDLVAWRVDSKGKIPYHQWPYNNDGVWMLLSHYEMGKSTCHIPDPIFAAVIDGVRDVLQRHQTQGAIFLPSTVPAYENPEIWDWLSEGASGFAQDHWVGTTEVIYEPGVFVTQKQTPRLATGNKKGPRSGADIPKGTTFESHYLFRSSTDNVTYRLTKNGNRVVAADLLPRDQVTVNGTVSRRITRGAAPVVLRKRPKVATE